MKIRKTILLVVAVFAVIVLNSMLFTIDQTEYAVVTQFGRPVTLARAIKCRTPRKTKRSPNIHQVATLINTALAISSARRRI